MEMHPLASAPHSLKDLLIHISIVTVGILIALSLEGIRESIHDHHLVRDARETFRIEIENDLDNMNHELDGVDKANQATSAVLADLPELQKDPAELRRRVHTLATNGWTINSGSWQGALSTGALAHMSADEVGRYSNFDYCVRWYTSMEQHAATDQMDLHSYVDSRHTFGPIEMQEVEQKVRIVATEARSMGFVGREVRTAMKEALPK